MKRIIEIPKGYEARIEDNNVVLELKESEDERIRKNLVNFICDAPLCEFNMREYLDWIEKHEESAWTEEDESFVTHILPRILNPSGWTSDQISADKKYLTEFIERQKRKFTKKQEPINECNAHEPTLDETRKCNEAYEKGYSLGYESGRNEKLKEQKHVGCGFKIGDTITDGMNTFKIVGIQDEYYIADDGDKVCFYVAHRYYTPLQQHKEQESAEWSEEDEKTIQWAYDVIRRIGEGTDPQIAKECAARLATKLKSLPNRIVSENKEWSEEDERNLTDAISAIEHLKNDCDWGYLGVGNDIDNVLNFLGSLPQRFSLQPKQEWSEEEKEKIRQNGRLDVCYNPEKYGLCHKIEWSEEDETFVKDAIEAVENYYSKGCGQEELVAWLKSLHPQPKQDMTSEKIKDLLKFIIRKCDLIINNENYTADEYAQDKVEDIAEMCHRVLDGQFGEIVPNPQPHWKPSEKQIMAVEAAYSVLNSHDTWGEDEHLPILVSLINDLKKLV